MSKRNSNNLYLENMIHKHYDNILFVVSELRILRYNSEYGKVTEKNNHIPMYGSI